MSSKQTLKYISTRGGAKGVSPAEAILQGLAPDGGLYMPDAPLGALSAAPAYAQTAARCLQAAFAGSFSAEQIEALCNQAYSARRFEDAAVTPLKPVGGNQVLELFHGPTASFKDLALSVLPGLMLMARDQLAPEKDMLVLVATSGDTGSATMAGFRDVPGVKVIVFYPLDGVSAVQQAQMQRMAGRNLKAVAITGDFDQAQRGVKLLFMRRESIAPHHLLSSANSINIGRLMPQMAYYLDAARQLGGSTPLTFSVPTGNFGDIFAGSLAWQAGLPIRQLLCATNANDVLKTALEQGVYDRRRGLAKTLSPSMDIVVSSNFERALYQALGEDPQRLRPLMDSLEQQGVLHIPPDALNRLRACFGAASCNDAAALQVIRRVFTAHGYLMDPHTAAAWHALEQAGIPGIALATASPYKFPAAALTALGIPVPEPAQQQIERLKQETGAPVPRVLDGLFDRPVLHQDCISPSAMEAYVREAVQQW